MRLLRFVWRYFQFLWSKFIVWKQGNPLRIIFVGSAAVFLCCASLLFYQLILQPAQAKSEIAVARSLHHGAAQNVPPARSAGSDSSAAGEQAEEKLSFSELRARNPDVEGWVTISGTELDYPVLQAPTSSPDFYLTHDWMRNSSKYGSVFAYSHDAKAPKNTAEKNTILYGHSMKDGTMFATLLEYDSLDYYRLHPVVQFQQGNEEASWKIFAVVKVNTDPAQGQPFDYQKRSFASEKDFLNYLYEVQIRSVFHLSVDLKPTDSILTLSTCSYEFDGFRTVVFARKVRTGEEEKTDTSQAQKNSEVLYPDCWYKKHGGTKPSLPDFQSAEKNGLPWLEEN